MASSDPVQPQVVEYDRITGVPSEFNEYLPKCACLQRHSICNGRYVCTRLWHVHGRVAVHRRQAALATSVDGLCLQQRRRVAADPHAARRHEGC